MGKVLVVQAKTCVLIASILYMGTEAWPIIPVLRGRDRKNLGASWSGDRVCLKKQRVIVEGTLQ